MKSYESSTMTLRMILAHPSLQRDKIDETMDAMASASADARDMDEAIRIGGDLTAEFDESELEDELRALLKETEREKEEEADKERLARLGNEELKVPRQPPDSVEDLEDLKSSTETSEQRQTVSA